MAQRKKIEKAKELYKTANADQRYVLESEDEKIRKWLITQLELKSDVNNPHDLELMILKSIAWLENQADETKAKMFLISKGYPIDANGMFPTYEEMYNIIKEGIEKQNNEKLEDKVGDWVVNKLGDSWHIDSFDKKNYQVSDGKGKYNYFPISKQDEMHLWTIQDAKDGDVLAYNDCSLTIFHYRLSGLNAGLFMSHVLLTVKIEFKQTCAISNLHPATKEQRNTLMKEMAYVGYTFDFEKKELKKIEPKAGDWLVHDERRIIIKVLKATPLDYEVVDVLGHHHTITGDAIKNNYHLWTIKDAKDGDILVVENIIFIYKNAFASHIVSCCKLINDVFEPTVDARTCCEGNPYVHPATKEQRELLFAKMEEAGYTFDFEKKELEKIEQNNTEEYIETKGLSELEAEELTKEISAEIDGNKVVIKKGNQKPIEWSEDEKIRKEIANYFKHYSGGDNISIEFPKWIAWLEKQAAWSEEDTETLNGIVNYLFTSTDVSSIEGSDKWYDWLKSLKNRVIPKQKWSVEDEGMYRELHNLIYSIQYYNSRKELSDWLESLKDRVQPKQEWDEEDERIYKSITYSFANNYPLTIQQQEFVKSLRPQKLCVYNPYKAVVESIAKMCNKYKNRMSDEEEAKDFLANVAAKCREAAEYDKQYMEE